MALEVWVSSRFFLITNDGIGNHGRCFAITLEGVEAAGVLVNASGLLTALAETTQHRKEDLVKEGHLVFVPFTQIKALIGPIV